MAGALAKWQARYAAASPEPVKQPDPLVVLAADLLPAGSAVDLACGAGRHAVYLAARGWRVTAVDGAPAALALFEGADKICLDLETEDVALAADLVVCTFYLDRALWPRMRAEARSVAIVLPMADDDPAVAPMNPAYLVTEGELAAAFPDWKVMRNGARKTPGARRVWEFLARRPAPE